METTPSRRRFLSMIGAGIIAGSASGTASASPTVSPTLYVYLPSEYTTRIDQGTVMDTAEDFAAQWNDYFDRNDEVGRVTVERGPEHDGDIFQQKLDNKGRQLIVNAGVDDIHHFVIDSPYDAAILDKVPKLSASDVPHVDPGGTGYGGSSSIAVEPEGDSTGPGITLTNWGAVSYWDDEQIAQNMFKHETLHTYGAHHYHGTVDYASGWLTIDHFKNISPMATSYVKRDPHAAVEATTLGITQNSDTLFAGTGHQVDEFANGTNNGKESSYFEHTGTISDAAFGAVNNHVLAYKYDDYCDRLCRIQRTND